MPPDDHSLDMLKLLLRYGADPNISLKISQSKFTPLTFLLRTYIDGGLKEMGIDELKYSSDDFYKQFKLSKSNQKNFKHMYSTYFINKILREKMRALLQYGADPFKKDDSGKDAFEIADEYFKTQTLAKLPYKFNFKNILNEEYGRLKRVKMEKRDIETMQAHILEHPDSRRSRARRAISKLKPDISTKSSLCNELENEMYKDELYELAMELGLTVTKKMTKKELCDKLAEVVV